MEGVIFRPYSPVKLLHLEGHPFILPYLKRYERSFRTSPWKSNQAVLEFIQRIGTSDENEVSSFVNAEIDARRPIYGFGHGVQGQKTQERDF